jgi:tyrosyl-tRNA synthetase
MPTVIDVLIERGFIEAMTSEDLRILSQQPLKIYCGFDPTSNSLHLGNMVAIMGLAWFQRYGHTPVAVVGGATGMIGDPSGKASERQLLDEETIHSNLKGITANLATLLDFNHPTNKPLILNNFDWFKTYSYIDFLREIGKYFRIGSMLAKESVKTRLDSDEGMSYTEFSYQLLQGFDFLYLYNHHQVNVQLGGSDQWGNITAGIELIRKRGGNTAYGLTFPLLTRADGQKFGKSENGAIWLSPERLSPYKFYQYLVRVADADVIKLMKMLTFMDIKEIQHYEKQMISADYPPNLAQKRLAEEVTRLIHGEEGLKIALKVTEGASPGTTTELNLEILESLGKDMPNICMSLNELIGIKLVDLLSQINLNLSKSEAKRLIRNGGVYINNTKIIDENCIIGYEQLIGDKVMLLALGKKNKILIRTSKAPS